MKLFGETYLKLTNPRVKLIFRGIDFICRQAFRIAIIILVYNLVK